MTLRTAPSINALVDAFRITEDEARTMRKYMHLGKLALASRVDSGFFGVETVWTTAGNPAFVYINTGDTYSPTIVRRNGSSAYRISTMGDEIESLERKGVGVQ